MKAGLFARALAASAPNSGISPTQMEKDRAVGLARFLLDNGRDQVLSIEEQRILARQLLRALALPA